jgi:uncharacterized repeat protein (TIGR03803 family)
MAVGFNGSDGNFPQGTPRVDAAGNIYGTASEGGDYDQGVVFKVTPR